MHLGGQDKADKGIGERDEMRIRRDQETRQLIERNRSPANIGKRAAVELLLDRVDGAADGVEPQHEATGAAPAVQLVAGKECLIVVGDTPVPRVEQEKLAVRRGYVRR